MMRAPGVALAPSGRWLAVGDEPPVDGFGLFGDASFGGFVAGVPDRVGLGTGLRAWRACRRRAREASARLANTARDDLHRFDTRL